MKTRIKSEEDRDYYDMPNGASVIALTETMNFCRGNVIKYVARAGRKSSTSELEDLRKARWYLEREIATLEARHGCRRSEAQ